MLTPEPDGPASGLRRPPQSRLPVPFALLGVMRPATRPQVDERRRPEVGHRIDVVPLEVIAAVASGFDARHTLELGHGAELECGAELSLHVAPKVRHRLDLDP